MKLIIGLGNPGEKYTQTRHNVGFWVVEKLANKGWQKEKGLEALVSGPYRHRYVLAKPTTYMNRSGEVIKRLLERSGLSDLWIIHDDADLALGVIRIQESGKRSTHNGVQSIVEALGGESFVRFRFGIGRPPAGRDWEDYVLTPFLPEQTEAVNKGVERMTEVVETALAEGIVMAMNRYNRS